MIKNKNKKPTLETPLSTRVYAELRCIPKGTVLTYKQLATKVGMPKAVRRIATIVGQNSEPISTPCHRVVRSDGKVGEYTYKGKRNQAKKISLLRSEGVKIVGDKVKNKVDNVTG